MVISPGAPALAQDISDEIAPPLMSNFLTVQLVFSCAAKNSAPGFLACSSVMHDLLTVVVFMLSIIFVGAPSGRPAILISTISTVFSHSPGSRVTSFITFATSSALILPSLSASAVLLEQPTINADAATAKTILFTGVILV